jgi:general stress protein 26
MDTVEEKVLKLIHQKIAFVGSITEKNTPNIKAMLIAQRDGNKIFYFASNNSAMRTKQFLQNKNACLYFIDDETYQGLMLEGILEIKNDREHKELIWDKCVKNAYKNGGINDPDYCVLKFTAKIGRYYCGFKTESFEIK